MSFNKENKPDNSLSQENDPAFANVDLSRMDSTGFLKVLPHHQPKRSRASSRSSSMRGNSPPSQKKEKEVHKSVIQEKANILPPKDWDEPSIPSEVRDLSNADTPINDESVVKYESLFPALGEDTPKTEEGEFTPEILNPQTIVQTSILKEATDTSSVAPNQDDFALQQSQTNTSELIDMSHEKPERHYEYANEWTKDAEPEKVVEIAVAEEKVEEYQNHFPALGTEAEEVHPQTEFTPEILEAEPKFAAENEGLEVITISQDKLHIPVESIPVEVMRESVGDRTPKNSETEEEAEQFETIPKIELEQVPSGVAHGFASRRSPTHQDLAQKGLPDDVPSTFSETIGHFAAHLPLDQISSGVAHGFASVRSPTHQELAKKGLADEVPATFSDTIASFGPDIMDVRIPLEEQIVGGMAKGYGYAGSPAHKDLANKNIPDEVPATFSDTVESFEREFMIKPLPLDEIPINIARGIEYTKTPTHLDMMKMGLPDEVPATFSASFEAWEKRQERPSILEQKLESELEQEEQVIEMMTGGIQQKFIGKYQRIKQDRDLEKMNENLTQSWEVIRTEQPEEIIDHTGYKPARVGDQEEAEGLLNQADLGTIEEEDFGTYKSSVARNKVEIKEEVPLQPVEENIVISPENQDEGINMQDLIKKDLKEIERNELSDRPFDDAKLGGEKSSLEHLAEDSNVANRSTELTLSSQRIDLIKEELKEVIDIAASRDPIFHEIERNIHRVKELQKSRMYGAAINLLKKSLEILDARLARHDTSFDIREMNKLLIQCNAELAQCYHQVIDYRLSMQYARAALNLDSKNTQAIYYLGSALNKSGDFLGGYNTLKEIKRFGLPAGHDDEYLILIESEIQNFERKVEDGAKKAEMGMVSPVLRDLPKTTRTPMEDKQDSASLALSNIGMFVGTSSLAGAASWMLSKNHFKLSEKKTMLYTIGIGALVGTASLALLGHFRKSKK